MSKPTITELMKILDNEESQAIEILPNGEIRAKDGSSLSETGGKKPLTMREDLGGEYVALSSLALHRIRTEAAQAANQFSYVELHSDGANGLVVRAALQTSVGNMYVAELRLDDYPSRMPNVYILKPTLQASPHKYKTGNICYLHPNMWNPGRHNLTFVLGRVAKWLNKYDVYRAKLTWPGAQLAH